MAKNGIYKWFVSWCALPEEFKQALGITTESRFAETSNVSKKQIGRWKKKPGFKIDVRKELKSFQLFKNDVN